MGIDSTLSVIDREDGGDRPATRPGLYVLLECSRPAAGSARYLLGDVSAIEVGRGPERAARRDGDQLALTLPDRWMSSKHARIERRFGNWVLTDPGSKNGTAVNGRPVQSVVLADGDLIETGHTLLRFRSRLEVDAGDRPVIDGTAGMTPAGMATLVPTLARELDQARRLATAGDIPFLIQGESGTGKELLARAVHELSGRPGELVAVNCGAIPENLVESELFGHVRGAFSGAQSDKVGLVRAADRGTLFLDEIGDLALASQAALLRVLQEREVMPVGANKPIPVDLRVVSATHRDLDAMVSRGEFRGDLYARLAGYNVDVPPLRERIDDIGLLIGALFHRLFGARAADHPGLELDAARALVAHDWPMNVRELESALRAGAALAGDRTIAAEHLPAAVRGERAPTAPGDPDRELRETLDAKLREHRGNVSAVARDLDKDRKQINRWLKRLAIDADAYRG
jgi:transcriptional regulator of acetoin/glycerol metabolism